MRNGIRKRLTPPAANGELSVFVVGSLEGLEFADARHWLTEHAATRADTPELIVLACARRGQFSAADVARWKSRYPLAKVVALVGGWCGGPWRRACDVLSGAWLVPWHQWNAWADFNCSLDRRRACPTWSLPTTSAADELAEFWSHHAAPDGDGLIAIDADDRDTAEAIADTLSLAGFAAAWCPESHDSMLRGAAGCVCDAAGMDERVAARLRRWREMHPSAAIALLLNFPQIADVQAALAAGADLIVGKPFTVSEFLGQLGTLVSPPTGRRRKDVAA